MNLTRQAQSLYDRLKAELYAAGDVERIAILADMARERLERRKRKCGLCGKTFASEQLMPNKYQGQLCEPCALIYECW